MVAALSRGRGAPGAVVSGADHSVFVMGWAGPWAMGWARAGAWAGLEFLRNERALDGPGLEFLNFMNNATGEIIYIKSNFIVLFNAGE